MLEGVRLERGVWGLPTPHPRSKAKQKRERERESGAGQLRCEHGMGEGRFFMAV